MSRDYNDNYAIEMLSYYPFYVDGFSCGFILQNRTKLVKGYWLNIPYTTEEGYYIDFLCRTNQDVLIKDLFPLTSRCDDSQHTILPSGTDLYFKVMCLSGKKTHEVREIIQDMIQSYEMLFTQIGCMYNSVANGKNKQKRVLLVYYGRDFVEIKELFVSVLFSTTIVFIPVNYCIEWEENVMIYENDKRLKLLSDHHQNRLSSDKKGYTIRGLLNRCSNLCKTKETIFPE